MATLYTCGIPPDSDGFNVLAGNSSISILLDGGGPRIRADQLGVVSRVSCQWSVDAKHFDYMMAFYRTGTKNGTQPFLISLVGVDSSIPTMYQAWIVGGTFKPVTKQEGLEYVVQAQLWVMPTTYSVANDMTLLNRYPS